MYVLSPPVELDVDCPGASSPASPPAPNPECVADPSKPPAAARLALCAPHAPLR